MSSTDYSESTEAFLQKYSDTSKYHPWDLTILKYSDELPEFMTLRYFSFWNAYQREEKIGTPPRLPIPAPPLRPAEVLEPAIEKWRQNILRVIESRIEHYSPRRIVDTTPLSNFTSFDASGTDDAIPHHALQIPEVIAIILHHAEPSSQYSAWHVSKLWRRTTEYIWSSQYKASTSPPVQYGQRVQKKTWEEPIEQEIDEMVKKMENIVHSERRPGLHYYFPARLTQANGLSEEIRALTRSAFGVNYASRTDLSVLGGSPQWSDLSQFKFNHYFLDLLSGHIELKYGRCEIQVQPGLTEHSTFHPPLPRSVFANYFNSMYLTDPPCRSLTIYPPLGSLQWRENMVKVQDPSGIRVGAFLAAVRGICGETTQCWKELVLHKMERIRESEWVQFTREGGKDWLFKYPGFPKLIALFEPAESGHNIEQHVSTLAEVGHWIAEDIGDMHKCEWESNRIRRSRESS